MATNKPSFHFSLTLFIFLSSDSILYHASSIKNPSRIITKLIHRDSILSPYYSNITLADRARQTRKSSMQRFKYLDAKSRGKLLDVNDTRADVYPNQDGVMFLANISIGEPPVPQLLAMDTGSSLVTMQCLPCINCYNQTIPYFDPPKSSTYANLSCASPSCTAYHTSGCDPSSNCRYLILYADGDYMEGTLVTEKLTFTTSDEGVISVSDVVLGCAHVSKSRLSNASGTLGLCHHELSLANKLGSIFSYCLGSISDPEYAYNQLILGHGAKIEGYAAQLEVFDTLYYLTLEGISVGETRLAIDPGVFKRKPSGEGGVVIDSGTTVTYIIKEAYDVLSAEVLKLINGKLESVTLPDYMSQLCFLGVIERDLVDFPEVTMHFTLEADLVLRTTNAFEKATDDVFCMAIAPSSAGSSLNIIGVMAQQNYNVAYDVQRGRIYFQSTDCALSDE